MPKTPMNENRNAMLRKNDVGFAGEVGAVQSEPEAQ
jgi:hypothetical protein